jgi:N-acetylglucosaminyldiphosphoundecaprenol N-acetyl-beta-D-mannosaminyltransferase
VTRLLGLEFADLDVAQAASQLAARPANAPFGYIVTPNADHLVRLHRRPELQTLYDGAMLRLLDSRVVQILCRVFRLDAPVIATGSDLTATLLMTQVPPDERVTIIGLRASCLPALIARCGIAAPAHFDPPMGFEKNPASLRQAVEFVIAHPARFVFLAVGSPRQEQLAAAIQATGRATGTGLCIGAGLDFIAGTSSRAPGWMRRCGLEWLHRLAGDPRRLARRYLLDCPAVVGMLWRE